MVDKQQKAIFSHSTDYARNYGFGKEFSYQFVSLTVTESREVTKLSAKTLHCVDCHCFA